MKLAVFLIAALCPLMALADSDESAYLSSVVKVPVQPSDLANKVSANYDTKNAYHIISSLKSEIKQAAKAMGVSPIHIAAAIAGEHAFNVNAQDTLQDYAAYLRFYKPKWVARSENMETNLFEMIKTEEFLPCLKQGVDYDYWYCVVVTWYKSPNYGGKSFKLSEKGFYKNFTDVFFNPDGMGSTFGVGQVNPLRALMVNDLVSKRKPNLSLSFRQDGNFEDVYGIILDPKSVVYVIAATVRVGIDAYRKIAHFDISENPGITATLYNVGQEKIKASAKFKKNKSLLKQGKKLEYPEPNKLGRWVLQNRAAIEATLK